MKVPSQVLEIRWSWRDSVHQRPCKCAVNCKVIKYCFHCSVCSILIFYPKTPASVIGLNWLASVGFWFVILFILTWMLLRSMDAPATKVDVKNINGKLDKMTKTLVENSTTLVQLINEMREIRKSQQFLSDQYEEMKKHLRSADEEVKTLSIENQNQIMSASLRLSLAKCKRILKQPWAVRHRECHEFQGLSCDESENTDQLVIGVSKLLQVDLQYVEFVLAPQHETSCNPEITTKEDFDYLKKVT